MLTPGYLLLDAIAETLDVAVALHRTACVLITYEDSTVMLFNGCDEKMMGEITLWSDDER